MNLIEKRQKMAALVADARTKLDAGDLEAYNKIDADIDTLSAEIKADEKQTALEDSLKKIPEPAHKTATPEDKKTENVVDSAEYKDAFLKAVREGKGSLSAEEKALFKNVMTVGTDTKGGFLVMPAEMETSIRDIMAKAVAMRRLATVITATADHKVPFISGYGAASWIGENGSYPKVDDSFDVKMLGSNKLGKIIPVSEELLNDSDFDLVGIINRSFARSFAEAEESAFVIGDGSDKPTGFLVDAIVGVTTASASAIIADELLDLFYALKVGYRSKATWLLNDSTEKALRKIKNGTTGDYMWQPGLTASQPNTLLGRPIAYSDYIPTITNAAKTLAFGDFSEYMIKDTKGMQMQVLDQLYAENGQVGFKGNERTDGKLLMPEAIQVLQMKA